MYPVKFLIACAVLFLGASFNGVAAPTDPLSKANRLPLSLEQIVRTVTEELTNEGYEVERGYWGLWGTDQCKYTISVLGRCFGPNPTAPYAVPFVPSWRDEFVDHSLHRVFGTERRGYPQIYRFDEREALVVFAAMPPRGAYFGLQTYVFTREDEINEEDPIYLDASAELRELLFAEAPNPLRVVVWSTIGDSINNVDIERQTGEAWQKDQQRFFIVTPDRATGRDVAAALGNAGVDDSQIFDEPVAADLVRLGLDAAADDFQTVVRYVQVPPDDDGDAWRERLPLAVVRVRYRDVSDPAHPIPYPVPEYDAKSAEPEAYLQGDLDDLVAEVQESWNPADAEVLPFVVTELPWTDGLDTVGQHCLARPMNCLGDNQDDSFSIGPTLSLDPETVTDGAVVQGDLVAVVGTLATATGNATYVSLSVSSYPLAVSFDNLTNLELAGTASEFSERVGNSEKFFVYYLSRDCSGIENCLEIPESVVPKGGSIKLAERNYVRPTTARAPDAAQLLGPVVIVMKGAAR